MIISVQQCCWARGWCCSWVGIEVSHKQQNCRLLVWALLLKYDNYHITGFVLPLCLEDVFLPYLVSDSGYVPVQKIIIAFILPVTSVFICWHCGLTYWWLFVLCSQCQSEEIKLSREEINIFTVRRVLSCFFVTRKFSQCSVKTFILE